MRGAPAFSVDSLARKDLTGPVRIARLALEEAAGGAVGAGLEGGEFALVYFAGVLDIAKGLGRRIGLRKMRGRRAPLCEAERRSDADEHSRTRDSGKRYETAAGTSRPIGLRR